MFAVLAAATAGAVEVLALNVEDLDLENRHAPSAPRAARAGSRYFRRCLRHSGKGAVSARHRQRRPRQPRDDISL